MHLCHTVCCPGPEHHSSHRIPAGVNMEREDRTAEHRDGNSSAKAVERDTNSDAENDTPLTKRFRSARHTESANEAHVRRLNYDDGQWDASGNAETAHSISLPATNEGDADKTSIHPAGGRGRKRAHSDDSGGGRLTANQAHEPQPDPDGGHLDTNGGDPTQTITQPHANDEGRSERTPAPAAEPRGRKRTHEDAELAQPQRGVHSTSGADKRARAASQDRGEEADDIAGHTIHAARARADKTHTHEHGRRGAHDGDNDTATGPAPAEPVVRVRVRGRDELVAKHSQHNSGDTQAEGREGLSEHHTATAAPAVSGGHVTNPRPAKQFAGQEKHGSNFQTPQTRDCADQFSHLDPLHKNMLETTPEGIKLIHNGPVPGTERFPGFRLNNGALLVYFYFIFLNSVKSACSREQKQELVSRMLKNLPDDQRRILTRLMLLNANAKQKTMQYALPAVPFAAEPTMTLGEFFELVTKWRSSSHRSKKKREALLAECARKLTKNEFAHAYAYLRNEVKIGLGAGSIVEVRDRVNQAP